MPAGSASAAEPQAVALADREAGNRPFGDGMRIEERPALRRVAARRPTRAAARRERALLGSATGGVICAPGMARRRVPERGQRVTRRSQRLRTQRSDRRPVWRVQLLPDQGANVGRAPHLAGVGDKPAREQPQQRALSSAVLANHSDALSSRDSTVWWLCGACGHEWQARVADRATATRCPMCARNRRRTDYRVMRNWCRQSRIGSENLAPEVRIIRALLRRR